MIDYLFTSNIVPIIIFVVACGIIISDYIYYQPARKISLEKRTVKKSDKDNFATIFTKSILMKFKSYEKLVDTVAFNMGYISPDSESKNYIRAERYIVKKLLLNLIILVALILHRESFVMIDIVTFLSLITIQLLYYRRTITIKKMKLVDEFPILINEFINAYSVERNIKSALQLVAKELSPVYAINLNRLVTQLNSFDTMEQAFKLFEKRVDYTLCSAFVSVLLNSFTSNKYTISNLMEVQQMVGINIDSEKRIKSKLKSLNNNNYLFIAIIIFEVVAVGQLFSTSTGNYFITTQEGQGLLLLSVVAIIIAITTIIIADKM